MVALKGGLVYLVHQHWLEGQTLYFDTIAGERYAVSLQELDMNLSARLNRERGQKFVLEVREGGAR
jgi:hypothetical protein